MAGLKKYKVVLLPLVFTALLLSGCALQLPPEGGPADTTPPEIVASYPVPGQINYGEDYAEIEFSEYVEKRSLKDAIFISPAPEEGYELNWSGKSVRIEFKKPLKENTTYYITVGTDLVDYNNRNKMAKSFNLWFSTGEKIDRGAISGNVYDKNSEGILIYAFLYEGDSVNIFDNKPLYVSQCGESGEFELKGLRDGKYRLIAVRDNFRDYMLQMGQDEAGVTFTDPVLSAADTLFSDMNFFMSSTDTLAPEMQSAVMTDRNHVLITLNEDADRKSVQSENFTVIDSATLKSHKPVFSYLQNGNGKNLVLILNEPGLRGDSVFLKATGLKDIKGNTLKEASINLTVSDRADTSVTTISSVLPSDRLNLSNDYPELTVIFNTGITPEEFAGRVAFTDTSGNRAESETVREDDVTYKIKITQKLESFTDYELTADLKGLAGVNGLKADTILSFPFKTINQLNLTGLFGKLTGIKDPAGKRLVLEFKDDPQIKYFASTGQNGEFEFDKVKPGKYFLWFYDSPGEFNPGSVFPFRFSDRFKFYKKEIELAPRWSQTDLIFDLKD